MNSGGIVAFAGGDKVEGDETADVINEAVDEAEATEEVEDAGIDQALTSKEAAQRYRQAMALAARELASRQEPSRETPLQTRARMIRENPERYGYLEKDQGEEMLSGLDTLQAARRAEIEKQREEATKMRPGILQLLGQAALASRGQTGRSALASILGNYAELQSGANKAEVQQEQAFRAKDLEMQQTKMEAVNKLRELKRARDEGDIAGENKALAEIDKIAERMGTNRANLIKSIVTSAAQAASRTSTAETRAQAQRDVAAEATKRKGIVTPGEKERVVTRIAALRAAGNDVEADRLEKAYRALGGSTADVGATNAQRAALNIRLKAANDILKGEVKGDKVAAQAERDQVLQLLRELPGGQPTGAPAAKPEAVPLPANPTPATLKVGTIYQTAKGPGRWNGSAFEAVQ